MGRKNREWYEDSCYHITCRGNHRNDLFRDEGDFSVYLELMRFSLKQLHDTPYQIICYCLMDNHVHLLMKMSTKPLSDFMKLLNLGYAKYFNEKYNYIGHLFQNRFFAEWIVLDKQLLATSRYIHLNPVRANMVSFPEDYPWSSYRAFIGKESIDFIVTAAAGGHNLLMSGTPGCGKSMIAKRIPTILPSMNSLIGGGTFAMPGEISLAHNGILFLDEVSEFSKKTLDALRQPIEDGVVTVSRVQHSHQFPSRFMLVAAMNPCPYGYYGDPRCHCTDYEVLKYRNKISGPIMDRIDI